MPILFSISDRGHTIPETLEAIHRRFIHRFIRGAGVILISPERFKIQQALKFSFPVTNNVAEYEAIIAGIKLAIELQVKILDIFGDS